MPPQGQVADALAAGTGSVTWTGSAWQISPAWSGPSAYNSSVILLPSGTATSTTNYGSYSLEFEWSYWNGSAAATGSSYLSVDGSGTLYWKGNSGTNLFTLTQSGSFTLNGTFSAQGGLSYQATTPTQRPINPNLVVDPAFEFGLSFWSWNTTGTWTPQGPGYAGAVPGAMYIPGNTSIAANSSLYIMSQPVDAVAVNWYAASALAAFTPGTSWGTISAYIEIVFLNSSGSQVGSVASAAIPMDGGWHTATVVGQAPSGTSYVSLAFVLAGGSSGGTTTTGWFALPKLEYVTGSSSVPTAWSNDLHYVGDVGGFLGSPTLFLGRLAVGAGISSSNTANANIALSVFNNASVQAAYYGFEATPNFGPPSTSANWAVWANTASNRVDFVSSAWAFVQANPSTYPSPMITFGPTNGTAAWIDYNGNGWFAGNVNASGGLKANGQMEYEVATLNLNTSSLNAAFTLYGQQVLVGHVMGTATYYLEVGLSSGLTTVTAYAQLYDVTVGAAVGNSLVSSSAGGLQVLRSGTLALTAGHVYSVGAYATTAGEAYLYEARIVAVI